VSSCAAVSTAVSLQCPVALPSAVLCPCSVQLSCLQHCCVPAVSSCAAVSTAVSLQCSVALLSLLLIYVDSCTTLHCRCIWTTDGAL